jgi:hypothetical protein
MPVRWGVLRVKESIKVSSVEYSAAAFLAVTSREDGSMALTDGSFRFFRALVGAPFAVALVAAAEAALEA